MAEVTAAMVKELREITGLGMMECKKALAETDGDLKKAEDLLRIKSGAKANKAASRVAAEGVIGAYLSGDAKLGALVELNCETDFVAKNDDFIALAKGLAELVAKENPADVAAVSQLNLGGENVEAKRQALVQKIGENISIRRIARIQTDAKIAQYLHGVKIGVLVEYEGEEEMGKDLAMHIAFAKPKAMSKNEIDPQDIERERGILAARAAESGKPADIVAKMVEGGINKFLAENTLLGQPFVKDDKMTVEKMLASRKTKLRGYKFFVVGEGIEKKVTDFAAEVAAQAGMAKP
ncbi:MAG TPA: translation elongation factor Ts [Burkholderiales bacterium]|nr:translation elongation factor Ts [Burkholderiales bacterium]